MNTPTATLNVPALRALQAQPPQLDSADACAVWHAAVEIATVIAGVAQRQTASLATPRGLTLEDLLDTPDLATQVWCAARLIYGWPATLATEAAEIVAGQAACDNAAGLRAVLSELVGLPEASPWEQTGDPPC